MRSALQIYPTHAVEERQLFRKKRTVDETRVYLPVTRTR